MGKPQKKAKKPEPEKEKKEPRQDKQKNLLKRPSGMNKILFRSIARFIKD